MQNSVVVRYIKKIDEHILDKYAKITISREAKWR